MQRFNILETLYCGFNDYAVDRRGDVGSWVRCEAMISLSKYFQIVISSPDELLKVSLGADQPEFYERFINLHL